MVFCGAWVLQGTAWSVACTGLFLLWSQAMWSSVLMEDSL